MAIFKLKLPRLTQGWDKQPKLLERYWDILCKSIEESINQILELPIILEALNQAIENAQNAANNANGVADTVTAEQSLVTSFPTNYTSPLVSANSLGKVTIANHSRQYGDPTLNPTVTVQGGSLLTGATSGSVVRIYYNDPTRQGGVVTYLYTVDPAPIPVQGGDVHSVGSVEIPATGSVDGGVVRPPGWSPSKLIP